MDTNAAFVLIILILSLFVGWLALLSTSKSLSNSPFIFRFEMDDNSLQAINITQRCYNDDNIKC